MWTKLFFSVILLAVVASLAAVAYGVGDMSDSRRIGAGISAALVLLGGIGLWKCNK
jgi:hypothetical protein